MEQRTTSMFAKEYEQLRNHGLTIQEDFKRIISINVTKELQVPSRHYIFSRVDDLSLLTCQRLFLRTLYKKNMIISTVQIETYTSV